MGVTCVIYPLSSLHVSALTDYTDIWKQWSPIFMFSDYFTPCHQLQPCLSVLIFFHLNCSQFIIKNKDVGGKKSLLKEFNLQNGNNWATILNIVKYICDNISVTGAFSVQNEYFHFSFTPERDTVCIQSDIYTFASGNYLITPSSSEYDRGHLPSAER